MGNSIFLVFYCESHNDYTDSLKKSKWYTIKEHLKKSYDFKSIERLQDEESIKVS